MQGRSARNSHEPTSRRQALLQLPCLPRDIARRPFLHSARPGRSWPRRRFRTGAGARWPRLPDGRQPRRQPRQPLPDVRGRCRNASRGPSDRTRAGDFLVDRWQRVLCQALDLVHCAARASRRQWLCWRSQMKDVAQFVREKLGHEPKDIHLFELALTHSSARAENYERLEFLGDRVLGHVIARALYDRYPNEPEGYLSRRYNGLVDRATCAENGREIGVPELVKLGKQAREDGANQSENVVGDVVEALIGALLIDGGMETARQFILTLWEPDLAEQRKAPKHPKSALQELAAARECKPPLYEVVN